MKTKFYFLALFVITGLTSIGQGMSADWAMSIGGSGQDRAMASVTDNSGNIYVIGYFNNTVDFDPGTGITELTSHGGSDVYILKLSPSGSFIWVKSIGGTNNDIPTDIVFQSPNIYISGSFPGTVDFDPGSGVQNITNGGIASLSSTGTFNWAGSIGGATIAGLSWDVSQSRLIAAGSFSGTVDFDPSSSTANKTSNGQQDIFVLSLSNLGALNWVNTIGGTDDDKATAVKVFNNGDICIAGTFRGQTPIDFDPGTGVYNVTNSSYMEDCFVEKFTSAGSFTWVKSFGGFDGERLQSMTIDNSGNIYSTGDFFMQVDFDPGSGVYNLSSHTSGNDVYIQKLDLNGNFVWAKSFGGNSPDLSYDIQTDNEGNVYTYGTFSSQKIDLNPNADSIFFYFPGGGYMNALFLQKLDSLGNFSYATSLISNNFDEASSISIDDSSNVCVIGSFSGDTLQLYSSALTGPVNHNLVDGFLVKYEQNKPQIIPSQSSFTAPPFSLSFQNNTGDSTNIRWFWDFGDGSFSYQMNPSHTYAYNGSYQVTLLAVDTIVGTADTATTIISCTGGATNPCSFNVALNETGAAIICANDSFRLSATAGNYSYTWFFNGIPISGANDSIFYGQAQGFYLAVVSNSACSKMTNYFTLANYPSSTPPISYWGSLSPCTNDSLKLSTSNYNAYLWSTGDTSAEIYVSQSGRYTVQGIDNNGCINTSAEAIINGSLADIPSICVVATDPISHHNVVVWEAPVTNNIDSFIVYRESNITNEYTRIGSRAYTGNSYLEDTNTNTSVRQYTYRITSLDTCGNETPMSNPHKSMHLMVNTTLNNHWNLYWKPYEGLNITTYKIYRGTDSLNMQLLTQVPGGSHSFTDINNPSGNVYYQVEAISTANCPTFNTIKSNIFNTANAGGTGFGAISNTLEQVHIYPNPSNGSFSIEFESTLNQRVKLHIYSILGKEVYQDVLYCQGKETIPVYLTTLAKGIYMVVLTTEQNQVYRGKVIIQ